MSFPNISFIFDLFLIFPGFQTTVMLNLAVFGGAALADISGAQEMHFPTFHYFNDWKLLGHWSLQASNKSDNHVTLTFDFLTSGSMHAEWLPSSICLPISQLKLFPLWTHTHRHIQTHTKSHHKSQMQLISHIFLLHPGWHTLHGMYTRRRYRRNRLKSGCWLDRADLRYSMYTMLSAPDIELMLPGRRLNGCKRQQHWYDLR